MSALYDKNGEYTLSSLINAITQRLQRKVFTSLEWSLSHQQIRALHYILCYHEAGEPVYQKMLESRFKIRAATASSIINSLEQAGYVKREAGKEDLRYKQLVPQPKAVELSSKIAVYLQEVDKYILQDIPPEDLAVCMRTLKIVAANIETLDAEKLKQFLQID